MRMVFPPRIESIRNLPFFLVGVGLEHPQEPIDRRQGYQDYQWIRTLQGEGMLTLGSVEQRVGAGMGMFLLPDEAHAYRGVGRSPWIVEWITFNGDGVPPLIAGYPFSASGAFPYANGRAFSTLANRAYAEGRFTDAGAGYRASGLIYELLLALRQFCGTQNAGAGEAGRLRLAPVLEWLEKHYREPVDLAGLAELVGISPQHLSRLFRTRFGMPPSEYLIRLRLAAAKDLLLSRPELRIAEIGEAVGYQDANYFSRVFRSREGGGPGRFRRDHGY